MVNHVWHLTGIVAITGGNERAQGIATGPWCAIMVGLLIYASANISKAVHISHQYLHHTHDVGHYRKLQGIHAKSSCMNRCMVRKYSRHVYIKWRGAKKAQSLVHTRLWTIFQPFTNICVYFDMALAQRFEGCTKICCTVGFKMT